MYKYGKNNTNITVKVNDEFAITLETMATGGYMWQYIIENQKNIQFIKEAFVLTNTKMGSSSYTQLIFKALKKGETTITMNYLREWETTSEGKIIFSILIQ